MVEYKQLEVACPVCQIVKNINVPTAIFSQKKFGTFKIQVPPGAVCLEHQFLVFVDTKGIVRGYEKIDLMMCRPVEEKEEAGSGRLNLRAFIKMFGLYGLFSIIHAKVFKYPAYIIRDVNCEYEFSPELINKVSNNMLPEIYQDTSSLEFLEETNYNKIKLKEKKALLMDSQQNILQTPWVDKLKFEESIIKKALDIIDEDEQFIILQQDVAKFIRAAEHVVIILENVKEIYEDDLIERLAIELMIPKINHYRLTLIKDFIRQRNKPKLVGKIKNKVEEFLNLL